MKTQTKILMAISILAALCIGFLAGINFHSKAPDRSDLVGTFGKADKYRNTQMTEKDIQLRSELLSDSVQLKGMIQGLMYFSLFTEDVSNQIDSCALAFEARGMGSDQTAKDDLQDLKQYSDFIKNNNLILQQTINLLSGFYTGELTDQSVDVEQKLRDFGAYVNRLQAMDSVLSKTIVNIDDFMLSETFKSSEEEIARLKSIRDQMLANGIQLSGVLNDRSLTYNLLSYALSSQDKYNALEGQDLSVIFYGQEQIQCVNSQDAIQAIGSSAGLSAHGTGYQAASGLGILYSAESKQFIAVDVKDINALGNVELQFLSAYKALSFLEAQNLNVIMNNYSLQNVLQSNNLGLLSLGALRLCSVDEMNFVLGSTGGLNNMIRFLSSQNLGVTL